MNQCLNCQTHTTNPKFCSQSCSAKYINALNRLVPKTIKEPTNKCQTCDSRTNNPRFCSKSCAAKHNNKIFPKRSIEAQNKCTTCGKRCSRGKEFSNTQYCKSCSAQHRCIEYGNTTTKKDCIKSSSHYASKHRYEKIRQHGKRLADILGWRSSCCEKCGYAKHTELCHIKPIASFTDETLLSEINSRQNISFLCPNCHWELDCL